MTLLVWGIKSSLVSYVTEMVDGEIAVEPPAETTPEGFAFRGRDTRFIGAVTLTGHSGMMRVRIADPALRAVSGGWVLEIADPHEPGRRLTFAEVGRFDGERGDGLVMTQDAADLFFGPYGAGTPVDPFRVLTD